MSLDSMLQKGELLLVSESCLTPGQECGTHKLKASRWHTSDAPEAASEWELPQLDLPAQQAPDLVLRILHSRLDILLHQVVISL